jgi:hypothetical protein
MPFKFNPLTGQLDLVNSSGSGPSGNVTGLPPTDINAIARWADTGGDIIKNSPGTLVQDSGAIQAQAFVFERQILNDVTIPDHYSMINSDIEMISGDLIMLGDSQLILV